MTNNFPRPGPVVECTRVKESGDPRGIRTETQGVVKEGRSWTIVVVELVNQFVPVSSTDSPGDPTVVRFGREVPGEVGRDGDRKRYRDRVTR